MITFLILSIACKGIFNIAYVFLGNVIKPALNVLVLKKKPKYYKKKFVVRLSCWNRIVGQMSYLQILIKEEGLMSKTYNEILLEQTIPNCETFDVFYLDYKLSL